MATHRVVEHLDVVEHVRGCGGPVGVVDNVLNREFAPDAPNKVWVTDITCIRTYEGWLFLAAVMDLYSRQIVGWATAPTMTSDLVLQALVAAAWRRKPGPGVMVHSDQGSQFTSSDWQSFLKVHRMVPSMSRRGNCHDSAVAVRSYEVDDGSPWLEWRSRFDVTFDDGSWLSDRKDPLPGQAKESLLGQRTGQQEALQDLHTVLRKIGLVDTDADALVLLYGRWSSPDGVHVRITSALTERKGSIGRCMAFAKQPAHDFWLPEFWDEGFYDRRHRQKSIFTPLVWAPETHRLGVDVGDELAAEGAAGRPRLGIDLTNSLRLANGPGSGDWRAADGSLALRSQVWGSWKPDPDNYRRARNHDDGEVLWASPDWLAATLSSENKRLVFSLTLWKYRSSREYAPSSGIRTVLVGLRLDDGTLRLWHAKKASKQDY